MPRLIETLRKRAKDKASELGHDMTKFFSDNHARCLVCGGQMYIDVDAALQIDGVCVRLSCESVLEMHGVANKALTRSVPIDEIMAHPEHSLRASDYLAVAPLTATQVNEQREAFLQRGEPKAACPALEDALAVALENTEALKTAMSIATPGKELTEDEKRAVLASVEQAELDRAMFGIAYMLVKEDGTVANVPPEKTSGKDGLLSFDEAPTMIVPPRAASAPPPPPKLNRHQRRMAEAKARKGGVR